MEEWSELETRHQEMKLKDPKHVEDFRKEMTTVSLKENNQKIVMINCSFSSATRKLSPLWRLNTKKRNDSWMKSISKE